MKRLLLTSGIFLALCQTVGAADEKQSDPPAVKNTASFRGIEMKALNANKGVTDCLAEEPCRDAKTVQRTKMALALLYLGIRNNCGQQTCKLHVTTVKQE